MKQGVLMVSALTPDLEVKGCRVATLFTLRVTFSSHHLDDFVESDVTLSHDKSH